MKNNGTRGCVVETCPNQFNGKRPKNLEIKVKKPGALGKKPVDVLMASRRIKSS